MYALDAKAAIFRSAWRLLPALAAILIPARVLSCEVGISSGNQTLTRCAFLDTNPTGELMTSGLPVTRTESHTATDDPVRWPDGLNGLSTPRRDPLLPSRRRQRRGPQR